MEPTMVHACQGKHERNQRMSMRIEARYRTQVETIILKTFSNVQWHCYSRVSRDGNYIFLQQL